MKGALSRRPSALLPVAMSATALAIVVAHAVMFGVARQTDEGAAAHLWQLLIVGQVPIVAFFAIRGARVDPRQCLMMLAFQLSAALAAIFPVWWLQW